MHPFSSSHWPIRGPQHPAGLEDEKGCPQKTAFDINGSRLTAPFEAVAAFLHRKRPVTESGSATMASGVPCETTSPPFSPPPEPMSSTWSAARIMSVLCSMTTTLAPLSTRRAFF